MLFRIFCCGAFVVVLVGCSSFEGAGRLKGINASANNPNTGAIDVEYNEFRVIPWNLFGGPPDIHVKREMVEKGLLKCGVTEGSDYLQRMADAVARCLNEYKMTAYLDYRVGEVYENVMVTGKGRTLLFHTTFGPGMLVTHTVPLD